MLKNLEKVQIVAHSAGTWAALGLAQGLHKFGSSELEIQVVYLDPFIPSQTSYSKTSIFSNAKYFNSDKVSSTPEYTNTILPDAIQVQAFYAVDFATDITDIEHLLFDDTTPTTVSWDWDEPEEGLVKRTDGDFKHDSWTTHRGPIKFYAESAGAPTAEKFEGYGWRQSLVYQDANAEPAQPILESPGNGSQDIATDTILVWNISDRAESYQVQLSKTVDFAYPNIVIDSSGVDSTIFQLSNLTSSTEYFWRVRAENSLSISDWSDVFSFTTKMLTSIEVESIPSSYFLHQNYPNPFNPGTTIRYDLPEAGNVNISVFDLTGRLVRTLQDGRKAAGSYTINFNSSGLASGVYFYQIRAGSFIETKRMMLIK